MSKTKKLNYKEMKVLERRFSNMSKREQEEIAAMNKMSVTQLKEALEQNCYHLNNLGINQMKELYRDIKVMSAEEITVIERVNQRKIAEIVELLDSEINEYEENMKKQRAFNKAWKIRQAEVQQQLIDEGVDKVQGYGSLKIDFMEHQKRMAEAKVLLAKEMGFHFTKYDPFIGVIEA